MATIKKYGIILGLFLALSNSFLLTASDEIFESAKTAYDNKQFSQAAQLFKEYLDANPKGQYLSASFFYLAELEEDFGYAQTYYLKIIAIQPDSPYKDDAYYKLGTTRFLIGDYEAAAQSFQALLDEFPASRWADKAQYHLGKTWLALNQVAKAKKAFTSVITEYQGSRQIPLAILGLVDCLRQEKMYSEALKTLQEFEKTYPASDFLHLVYFNSAESYRLLGDNGKAMEYYKKLIEKYPDSFETEEARRRIALFSSAQPKTYFSIQIGAFSVAENALQLKENMEFKGYNDVYLKPLDKNGKILHQVHIGHYLNKSDAKQIMLKIKKEEKLPTRLVFTNLD